MLYQCCSLVFHVSRSKRGAACMSEQDAKKTLEDAIQKTTDSYVKKVEDMVKAKSDELLKV